MTEQELWAAAALFERANGSPLTDEQRQMIDACGFAGRDPQELCHAIAIWLATVPISDRALLTAAYWALGRRHDPALIPVLQDGLRLFAERDIRVAYQIMIGLANLREPVFGTERTSNGGVAADEDALNLRDALAYLEHCAASQA